jgi:hypothetical protein
MHAAFTLVIAGVSDKIMRQIWWVRKREYKWAFFTFTLEPFSLRVADTT